MLLGLLHWGQFTIDILHWGNSQLTFIGAHSHFIGSHSHSNLQADAVCTPHRGVCGFPYISGALSPSGHGFCTNPDCFRSFNAKKRRHGRHDVQRRQALLHCGSRPCASSFLSVCSKMRIEPARPDRPADPPPHAQTLNES